MKAPFRLRLGHTRQKHADTAATPPVALRAASLGVAIAVLLVGSAAVSALRIGSLATPQPRPRLPTITLLPRASATLNDSALRVASDHNVFASDRRRGGVFQPGESGPDAGGAAASAPAAPQPDKVSLLGTVIVAAGRSFVVCTVNGGPFQLVKLGDQCGNLTLEAVRRERGEFRGPDGKVLTVELPKEGTR